MIYINIVMYFCRYFDVQINLLEWVCKIKFKFRFVIVVLRSWGLRQQMDNKAGKHICC